MTNEPNPELVADVLDKPKREVRCFGFHCSLRNQCQKYFGNNPFTPGNHITTDFFPHSDECVKFVRMR